LTKKTGFFAPLFCAGIEKRSYLPAEKSAFRGIDNGADKKIMKIFCFILAIFTFVE
jgi:hypothetical protein